MHIVQTILQLLAFRLTRNEMLQFKKEHFIAGTYRYMDRGNGTLLG